MQCADGGRGMQTDLQPRVGLRDELLDPIAFRAGNRFVGAGERRLNQVPDDGGDLLLGARAYAERGWLVLPLWWPPAGGACACGRPDCSKPGKHPLTRHGVYDATVDPLVIGRWWSRWPEANVGIHTGANSGLLVVDIDGRPGMESLRALSRHYGPLAATWVRTGSGGWHTYLRLPEGQRVPNSVARLGPGLDVRADGGSIVAPPSRQSAVPLAETRRGAPEGTRLAATARPAAPAASRASAPRTGTTGERSVRACRRPPRGGVAEAPAGTRNHRLNLAAWRLGRLVAGGVVDEAIASEALLAAAVASGLPHHESVGTLRSGMSAGRPSPRQPRAAVAALSSAAVTFRRRASSP